MSLWKWRSRKPDVALSPWRHREWLIEDHGVLLWLRGFRMSDAVFDALAASAQATLREPEETQ